MAKERNLRIRCDDAEKRDWNEYVASREMDFSGWARKAIQFCREAELRGDLDLKEDTPVYRGEDARTTLQKVADALEWFEQQKRLTSESGKP